MAWYLLKARLSTFAHSISMEDRMFALIGLIVFLITVFIPHLQAVKSNPVLNLRTE